MYDYKDARLTAKNPVVSEKVNPNSRQDFKPTPTSRNVDEAVYTRSVNDAYVVIVYSNRSADCCVSFYSNRISIIDDVKN